MASNDNSNNNNVQAPIMRIATRTKANGVQFYDSLELKDVEDFKVEETLQFEYSKDGSRLALILADKVLIYDTGTNSLVSTINRSKVLAVSFSPLNTFLVTWSRYQKPKPEELEEVNKYENMRGNLVIWEIASGTALHSNVQKNFSKDAWPSVCWTDDEMVSVRVVANAVQFFAGRRFKTFAKQLKIQNIKHAVFGKGSNYPYKCAIFCAETKGGPAFFRIYDYTGAAVTQICNKSFHKAQSATVKWNSKGTACLALSHTDVDSSGKSYYGETSLYYCNTKGVSQRVDLTEGAVYDFQWSPNGTKFIVLYGYPQKITLFNEDCTKGWEFPNAHRNTARWSPNGNILCVAGFGSLLGDMDFWDVKRMHKVGTCRANSTVHYEWAPNSQYMLTATCAPRLNVDNGIKIWKWTGECILEKDIDVLYQVAFQPMDSKLFPNFLPPKTAALTSSTSTAPAAATTKPAVYRPPHFSKTKAASVVPGAEKVAEKPKKYSNANSKPVNTGPVGYNPIQKKKRNRKRGNKATTTTEQEAPQATTSASTGAKRIKNIKKKLRQIDALKEKAKTEPITEDQEKKIATESELKLELATLEAAEQ